MVTITYSNKSRLLQKHILRFFNKNIDTQQIFAMFLTFSKLFLINTVVL